MLGDKELDTLQNLRLLDLFTPKEVKLIDYIIESGKLPHFNSDLPELKDYRTLSRLRIKLGKYNDKVISLRQLFQIVDTLKVSNKSIGGEVN